MSAKNLRIPLVILVLVFAAVSLPVCGCGNNSKSSNSYSNAATYPTTPLQNTVPPTPTSSSQSKQAVERARVEGKPVLVCFHSLKCAPCIQIEQNLNQVMPEYQGKVEFVILDVNDPAEYDFCMENNIQTIPTTIFIKSDGQVKDGFVGVLTPEELREKLNALP